MILSDNETKFDLLNNEAIAKTVVNLIKESNNQPILKHLFITCKAVMHLVLEFS